MTMAEHPAELELLSLVEGELSRSEARALEAHLATCGVCRRAVEAQRGTRMLLRGAPAVPPLAPQQVRDLVRALPAHPRPRPWWRRRAALVLTPAFGLAIAAAVVVALSNGTRQPQPSAVEPAPTVGAAARAAPSAQLAPSASVGPSAQLAPATTAPYGDAGRLRPLATVAGTPGRVIAFLRALGIVATMHDGQVLVRGADGPRARAALAILPSGPVRVLVR